MECKYTVGACQAAVCSARSHAHTQRSGIHCTLLVCSNFDIDEHSFSQNSEIEATSLLKSLLIVCVEALVDTFNIFKYCEICNDVKIGELYSL